MKNLIMSLLLITGISLCVSAQDVRKIKAKDVPQEVQTALKNAYPDAKDIDWKMKEGKYKAHFEMNDVNHMARLTASGEIISRGMEIKRADLPTEITTAIQSNHAGYNIDDVYRIEENGSINYLVELDGRPDKKVLYSADGKLIKEMPDKR